MLGPSNALGFHCGYHKWRKNILKRLPRTYPKFPLANTNVIEKALTPELKKGNKKIPTGMSVPLDLPSNG
jgi:hypothetical protein